MDVHHVSSVNRPPIPPDVLRIDYASGFDGRPDWALVRPGRNPKLWIVCLHGHGAHGDQLYTREDVRALRLPEYERRGAGIVTPNLRDNAWMGPAAVHDLHVLLEFVRAEWKAETLIFFSGSMGGTGNLIYAVRHPSDVAAVVGLGVATDLASYHGWCRQRNEGVVREIADAIEHSYDGRPQDVPSAYHEHSAVEHADRLRMPVFLAHGESDAIIPVEQARRLAEAMSGRGKFAYEEIPGGNHDSPLGKMEALDWVLEHLER